MISVVLTSYNGEKYIERLLNSIMLQTRVPDEVIICDDCSRDNTVNIVKEFISKNNLNNWYLFENLKNLGWKKNFYEAVKRSKGDIIFFSDQDDEWMPDKIEIMSECMDKYNAGCVYGECYIIDENSNLVRERMTRTTWTGKIEQVKFDKKFNTRITLGCCMCISRKIADIYINLNEPESGHDTQCGRLSLLFSTMYHIDKPVINYRIHGNNTSGINSRVSFGKSTLEKRIDDISQNIRWLKKIKNTYVFENENINLLDSLIRMQTDRLYYLKKEKGFNILKLIKYIKYYSNLSMWIGDFSYRYGFNDFMGRIRWSIGKVAKI